MVYNIKTLNAQIPIYIHISGIMKKQRKHKNQETFASKAYASTFWHAHVVGC